MLDLMHRRLGSRPRLVRFRQRILVVSCPMGRTTELLCLGHPLRWRLVPPWLVRLSIRYSVERFGSHPLHILVSGSIASVSECCLKVQNWVLRGFRGYYSGAMLGSMVVTCSASVPAALGRLPHFLCGPVFRREQSLPPVWLAGAVIT